MEMTSHSRPSSINEMAVVELSYFWWVHQQAMHKVSSNSVHPFPVKSEQRKAAVFLNRWENRNSRRLRPCIFGLFSFYWPIALRLDEIPLAISHQVEDWGLVGKNSLRIIHYQGCVLLTVLEIIFVFWQFPKILPTPDIYKYSCHSF